MDTLTDFYTRITKAYSKHDQPEMNDILDDNVTFNCQYFEEAAPMAGRVKVTKTLTEILTKLREAKPTVLPELAVMGDQSNSQARFRDVNQGDPCLLFVNNQDDTKGAVCVAKMNEANKIITINICRILQRLTAIEGTGVYPK